MKSESLQKWALIAEIIGGVAIVLSLAFVGLQIRQGAEQTELNTRAVEVSAYQDLVNQINVMYLELFRDDESAELVFAFLANEVTLDEAQRRHIILFLNYTFRHSEMSFLQFDKGLISEEQLFSIMLPIRQVLNTEFGMERWKRAQFARNFVEYVEAQLAIGWPPISE